MIAGELRLPWAGVVEQVVDFLSQEKLVDLRGGKGFGRASVDFVLTEKGREYARDALGRTTYVGPAPVPIEQYNALITGQTEENPVISEEELRMALSHLTVPAARDGQAGARGELRALAVPLWAAGQRQDVPRRGHLRHVRRRGVHSALHRDRQPDHQGLRHAQPHRHPAGGQPIRLAAGRPSRWTSAGSSAAGPLSSWAAS